MKHFVNIAREPCHPQLLDVVYQDGLCSFHVEHAGTQAHEKTQDTRNYCSQHSHAVFHAVLYTSGMNSFYVDGNRHTGRCGVLAVVDPMTPHAFGQPEPDAVTYTSLNFVLRQGVADQIFRWSRYLSLLFGKNLSGSGFVTELSVSDFDYMRGRINSIADSLCMGADASWAQAYSEIASLLGWMADVLFKTVPSPEQDRKDGLDTARLYMEREYRTKITVDELAEISHMSRAHFIRSFHVKFSHSPIEYLRIIRIEAAKNLLRSTNLPCKAIAGQCGFHDEYFFSRTFLKINGKTPSAYRKEFLS